MASPRLLNVWKESGALGAILALGIFLRLYRLDSLPPGLYWDEAFNGLDALRVLGGYFTPFFESNYGREPLFIYLVAVSVAFFGRTALAIHIVAVLLGTLSILATYALARQLMGRQIALLSALLLSISYWHLSLSRLGFRAISLPLFEALTMLFLLKGLQGGRKLDYALGGLFLGATMYTYSSARFFPLVVLALLLLHWVSGRSFLGSLQGVALFAVLTLLVSAPLGLYALNHWDDFLRRAQGVSAFNPEINRGDLPGQLWRNTSGTLGMFLFKGDTNPRHNLPGRPIFDPFMAPIFLLGLGLLLARSKEPRNALLLLWIAIMLLPGLLTDSAPHFLRTAGIMPAVFLILALGLGEAWNWLRMKGLPFSLAQPVLALLLVGSTISAFYDYFYRWPARPELAVWFNLDQVELAQRVNSLTHEPQNRVYLSEDLWHATNEYLIQPSPRLSIFPPIGAIPMSTEAFFLLPYWDAETFFRERPQMGAKPMLFRVEATGGIGDLPIVTLRVGSLANTAASPPEGNLANLTELVAYEIGAPEALNPGESITVTLYWQARSSIPEDYTVFVHFLNEQGQRWGQHDGQPMGGFYPTSFWQPGDIVLDEHTLTLAADAPPGTYHLDVGLYRLSDMQRLSTLDAEGRPSGNAISLKPAIRVKDRAG